MWASHHHADRAVVQCPSQLGHRHVGMFPGQRGEVSEPVGIGGLRLGYLVVDGARGLVAGLGGATIHVRCRERHYRDVDPSLIQPLDEEVVIEDRRREDQVGLAVDDQILAPVLAARDRVPLAAMLEVHPLPRRAEHVGVNVDDRHGVLRGVPSITKSWPPGASNWVPRPFALYQRGLNRGIDGSRRTDNLLRVDTLCSHRAVSPGCALRTKFYVPAKGMSIEPDTAPNRTFRARSTNWAGAGIPTFISLAHTI